MSDLPLSLAFFDSAHRLSGTARSGMTLLFDGTSPATLRDAPELERTAEGRFTARLAGRLDLDFEPVAEPAQLAGARVTICAVRGEVSGRHVECLGTATETETPPE